MRPVPLLFLLLLLLVGSGLVAEEDNGWRAGPAVLAERVERLAGAGEVDAAATVLRELLSRPQIELTGLDDRARMALARGYLAADRTGEALATVRAVPWADKDPQIAAAIIAVELAIRWQGLLDDHRLVSGMLPPQDVRDSEAGTDGGGFARRREHVRALEDLLVRGTRMVEAEGGSVVRPTDPSLLALARYAHGALDAQELARALGPAATWPAALGLAVARLHLDEHEIDAAMAAAEALWAGADTEAGATIYRELRCWQLRRRAMQDSLRLWRYTAHDTRLDDLAVRFVGAAAEAAQRVAAESDLQGAAMAGQVEQALREEPIIEEDLPGDGTSIEAETPIVVGEPEWRRATSYGDLQLQIAAEVSAGTCATVGVSSILRGPHRLQVWQLADRSAWEALSATPDRALLPDQPLLQRILYLDDLGSLGRPLRSTLELPVLDEGYYALTLSARGSPVVVLSGCVVLDPALHLLAGRDGALAWVVSRRTGQAKADEPLHLHGELIRDPAAAAGAAWAEAGPAWQAGFRQGFGCDTERLFLAEHQQAEHRAGIAAGQAAAASDPPQAFERELRSDADGLVRCPVPATWSGRSWRLRASIARPEVAVAAQASWGAAAHWTARAVAWADRPLVRPGERLGWRLLLRDFDGDRYRLPTGRLRVALRVGEVVLSDSLCDLAADGSLHGELLVPPATPPGPLVLRLDDRSDHHLGRVEAVTLPDIQAEVLGGTSGESIRAGETAPVTVTLRDRSGQPLEDIELRPFLRCVTATGELPVEQPAAQRSDLAGRAVWAIPTLPDQEATWLLELRCTVAGTAYRLHHSFRTGIFPFACETVLSRRDWQVGDLLRLGLRLPGSATVSVVLERDGRPLTEPRQVRGRADGLWSELLIPLSARQRSADTLLISCPTLDGRQAQRRLAVTVEHSAGPEVARRFALHLRRTRLDPGETLEVVLGSDRPGSDVLLIGGAAGIIEGSRHRCEAAVTRIERTVTPEWAPDLALQAWAWRDGAFVATEPQRVEVRPIDRLLKVAVTLPEGELRPGSTVTVQVQVRDWQDAPVQAHLSLGAVDSSLYQMAEDATPDLWRYFHERQRPWRLVTGSAEILVRPQAELWRSVIRRWQRDESWVSGSGRGVGRYGGSRCGACGRHTEGRLVRPEQDTVILWLGDLRTDAAGRATITLQLPVRPGRWRLTARANDASAAPLVGELRTIVQSGRPVQALAKGPATARPGDQIAIAVTLHNRSDRARPVAVHLAEAAERLLLPAHSRRELVLPWTVASPDAPVVARGRLLGRIADLRLTIEESDDRQELLVPVLVVLPGLPEEHRLVAIAAGDGQVPMAIAVPAGSAIQLTARAWGDGPRRAAAWAMGRPDTAIQVLRAMQAPASAARREDLAALWPRLGDDAAACLVRQEARALALSGARLQACAGAEGDWLLARGRALGLDLPQPARRGIGTASERERGLRIVTGRLLGWSEANAPWLALVDELLAAPPPIDDAQRGLLLALCTDTARILSDTATAERLGRSLARAAWDELGGALAMIAFAAQAPAPAVTPEILGGDGAGDLTDGHCATWAGLATAGFALRAPPGTLVELDLIVQRRLPAPPAGLLRQRWWQEEDGRWYPVPEGAPLWPGRSTLLELTAGDQTVDWDLYLGGVWQLATEPMPLRLYRGRELRWDVGALPSLGSEVLPVLLADQAPRVLEREDTQQSHAADGLDQAGGTLDAGCSVWLALRALHPGRAGAAPLRLRWWGDEMLPRVADMAVAEQVIAPGRSLLPEPERADHPLLTMPERLLPLLTPESWHWLQRELGGTATAAEWIAALRILDPEAGHCLAELLRHPRCGEPGHWTVDALRAWLDADPLARSPGDWYRELADWPDPGAGDPGLFRWLAADADPTRQRDCRLAKLADLRRDLDSLRRAAWLALPQPKQAPQGEPPTLADWYGYCRRYRPGPSSGLATWAWTQEFDSAWLTATGHPQDLEGWVAWLDEQLDLTVRIAAQVPIRHGRQGSLWRIGSGAQLGTAHLLEQGLILVATAEAWEVRPWGPLVPGASTTITSIDFTCEDLDIEELVAYLDRVLRHRGLGGVRLQRGDDDPATLDEPLTMQLDGLPPQRVLEHVAQLVGLRLLREGGDWVLRR